MAIKDLAIRGVIKPIKFGKLDFSNTLRIAHKGRINLLRRLIHQTAKSVEATLVAED